MLLLSVIFLFVFWIRYLVLDIADNPVENIIRFFPMVSQIFIYSAVTRTLSDLSCKYHGLYWCIPYFNRLKNLLMAV